MCICVCCYQRQWMPRWRGQRWERELRRRRGGSTPERGRQSPVWDFASYFVFVFFVHHNFVFVFLNIFCIFYHILLNGSLDFVSYFRFCIRFWILYHIWYFLSHLLKIASWIGILYSIAFWKYFHFGLKLFQFSHFNSFCIFCSWISTDHQGEAAKALHSGLFHFLGSLEELLQLFPFCNRFQIFQWLLYFHLLCCLQCP